MNEPLFTPRTIMSYFWCVVVAAMLFYILVEFGKEKEILTLVIGIIGGTILGGIFGVYFGANHKGLTEAKTTTEVTEDTTTVTTEK